MPNRVIKESIKRSPQIDSLTWFEEVVFYRLIVTADDYGCLDGRITLLKNELFPTKDTITKKSIEDAIQKLASVGLLRLYEVSGMPYIALPTWERHQRIRNKYRKYPPPPPEEDLTANRGQMTANCPYESESNPNPNPWGTGACAREEQPPTEDLDDGWTRVVSAYEANIYPVLPRGRALEALISYCEDLGADVVCAAIEATNLAQPDAPRPYLSRLLASWAERGVNTLSAAQAEMRLHRQRGRERRQGEQNEPPVKFFRHQNDGGDAR